MEEVILSELTQTEKGYKIGGFFLGLVLIYSFITDFHWGKLFMGIIFLLVSGYKKESKVTKEGIEHTYNYFGVKRYETLKFQDLKEVVVVKSAGKNLVYLVEEKDSKKSQMNQEKLDQMTDFIKKHSDVTIRIEDLN